jgi:hypothetical protein
MKEVAMKRLFRIIASAMVIAALLAFVVRRFRTSGRVRGAMYRIAGRHPDPNVDDRTLADRVRSELGPVEKQLDVPHVHVMVQDHVVALHGDVEWPHEAATIERAARHVSGVRAVESHLHIGLLPGDSRPSWGALHRKRLVSAS